MGSVSSSPNLQLCSAWCWCLELSLDSANIYNYTDICSIPEILLIDSCKGINFVVASSRKTWKDAGRQFCRATVGSAYSYPSCLARALDSDENPSPSSRHENGALRSSGTAGAAGNEGLRRNAASSP